jgi:AcrR family transcriptional regulator
MGTAISSRGSGADPGTDGRTARKLANRDRILDAALALVEEGSELTADTIADRAEVSVRSVYNHFATVQDLVAGMYERGTDKLRPLFAYFPEPSAPFDVRVREWVAVIARIREEIAPIRWRALVAESENPEMQPQMAELRRMHRAEIERMFPEIKTEEGRQTAVAMTSSLGWRSLRQHQGLSFEEATGVLEETIRRLAG